MTENNNREFGPHDSMSWCTSSLAWVFAANTKAALDDPERRVHGYLRDVIRVQGIERPYIVRPRGKSGRSATAFAWVRGGRVMKYRSNSFQDLGTDPSCHLFRIVEVKCGSVQV